MKEALKQLDAIKINSSNFNCDNDDGSDGPTAIGQELLKDFVRHQHMTLTAVSVDCNLYSVTD